MKHFKSVLFLTTFLLANIGAGYAHALYIDTNPNGNIGEAQEVNIYYSEFADRTHEKVADWYSDVAQFQLWLVQPNGERAKLETKAHKDHLSASFVPTEEGNYRLEISHTTADVAEGTAYQFNAFSQVAVGKSDRTAEIGNNAPDFVLVEEVQSGKNDQSKIFRVYFKGEPAEGIAATLFMPSGETKDLKSNAEGILEFTSEEKGVHFLEATTYHEDEAGETKKQPYKALWRAATQKIVL